MERIKATLPEEVPTLAKLPYYPSYCGEEEGNYDDNSLLLSSSSSFYKDEWKEKTLRKSSSEAIMKKQTQSVSSVSLSSGDTTQRQRPTITKKRSLISKMKRSLSSSSRWQPKRRDNRPVRWANQLSCILTKREYERMGYDYDNASIQNDKESHCDIDFLQPTQDEEGNYGYAEEEESFLKIHSSSSSRPSPPSLSDKSKNKTISSPFSFHHLLSKSPISLSSFRAALHNPHFSVPSVRYFSFELIKNNAKLFRSHLIPILEQLQTMKIGSLLLRYPKDFFSKQQNKKEHKQPKSILYDLAYERRYNDLLQRCRTHPEEAMYVTSSRGNTPLHAICAWGGGVDITTTTETFTAPDGRNATKTTTTRTTALDAILTLLLAFPPSVSQQNRSGLYSPLHLLCWWGLSCQQVKNDGDDNTCNDESENDCCAVAVEMLASFSNLITMERLRRQQLEKEKEEEEEEKFSSSIDDKNIFHLRDRYGRTALHLAILTPTACHAPTVIECLLRHDPNPSQTILARDDHNRTVWGVFNQKYTNEINMILEEVYREEREKMPVIGKDNGNQGANGGFGGLETTTFPFQSQNDYCNHRNEEVTIVTPEAASKTAKTTIAAVSNPVKVGSCAYLSSIWMKAELLLLATYYCHKIDTAITAVTPEKNNQDSKRNNRHFKFRSRYCHRLSQSSASASPSCPRRSTVTTSIDAATLPWNTNSHRRCHVLHAATSLYVDGTCPNIALWNLALHVNISQLTMTDENGDLPVHVACRSIMLMMEKKGQCFCSSRTSHEVKVTMEKRTKKEEKRFMDGNSKCCDNVATEENTKQVKHKHVWDTSKQQQQWHERHKKEQRKEHQSRIIRAIHILYKMLDIKLSLANIGDSRGNLALSIAINSLFGHQNNVDCCCCGYGSNRINAGRDQNHVPTKKSWGQRSEEKNDEKKDLSTEDAKEDDNRYKMFLLHMLVAAYPGAIDNVPGMHDALYPCVMQKFGAGTFSPQRGSGLVGENDFDDGDNGNYTEGDEECCMYEDIGKHKRKDFQNKNQESDDVISRAMKGWNVVYQLLRENPGLLMHQK